MRTGPDTTLLENVMAPALRGLAFKIKSIFLETRFYLRQKSDFRQKLE